MGIDFVFVSAIFRLDIITFLMMCIIGFKVVSFNPAHGDVYSKTNHVPQCLRSGISGVATIDATTHMRAQINQQKQCYIL